MLSETVRTAAVSEVLWHGPSGLEATTAIPLAGAPSPGVVLALPASRTPLVRRLAELDEVLVASTDARPTRAGWTPSAARCTVRIQEDPAGERYLDDGLMGEELLKSPALRAMLDTPVLRREHWWLMPRWLIHLEVAAAVAAPRRGGAATALVVSWGPGDQPLLGTADGVAWDADPLDLADSHPQLPDGPAAVMTHDWADADRAHHQLCLRAGRLESGRLHVSRTSGSPGPHRVPGLIARLRATRDLERACRAHIADLGWD